MYTGKEFLEIIEPFSSHSHNGALPASNLKVVDFPETADGPLVHHVVCQLCGRDLTFGGKGSKHNLGGNPMPESKLMPA